MIHICTEESLIQGGIEFVGYCPICCTDTNLQKVGYVSSYCTGCERGSSMEDCNNTVRQRREFLGHTRREMGEKIGVKPKTVSNYENIWPSRKYWEATKALVLQARLATQAEN